MMILLELKHLILLQIGIDFAIFVLFLLFMKKLRVYNRDPSLRKGLKACESILTDMDNMAVKFKTMLQEKKDIISTVNEQLDQRITSLNAMLNRADVLLFEYRQNGGVKIDSNTIQNHGKEIVKLSEEGHDLEYIAHTLSIPKEEVLLVLDLRKKYQH